MANYTQRTTHRGANGKSKKKNIFVRMFCAIFPVKGDSTSEVVRKLIFLVAVVAFIVTGGMLLRDVGDEFIQMHFVDNEIRDLKGEITLDDEAYKEIIKDVPNMKPSFAALYSQNKDTKGWLKVPGTIIDYPIVQAATNEYYLEHNFKGESSKRGSIFIDYRNKLTPTEMSNNTILYGHNIWSGEQFAEVTRYYPMPKNNYDNAAFYKEHPVIEFETMFPHGSTQWKVFACVLFNTQEKYGEVYPYLRYREFDSKDTFNNFILDVMDRSTLFTDVDITYGDKLLTLSTCYYPYGGVDTRCVVFARQVREGEDPTVDVSKAVQNKSPLRFKYEATAMGTTYPGRTWDTSKLLSLN